MKLPFSQKPIFYVVLGVLLVIAELDGGASDSWIYFIYFSWGAFVVYTLQFNIPVKKLFMR